MSMDDVQRVMDAHVAELMAVEGVVGVAVGLLEDRPCIKVMTLARTQRMRDRIPDSLEGYPVVLEETGPFHAV
jgi:hypothetical protein